MSDTRSIYLHIPFCRKKCGYCDFYSITDQELVSEYIQCLVREMEMRAQTSGLAGGVAGEPAAGRRQVVNTVYFGGGTPSLLPIDAVETIMETVEKLFAPAPDAEISFEVNPGTIDPGYFRGLKQAGINRISLGAQSFNPEKLSFLGRIHTADQTKDAIEQACSEGFDNISLDLIYGLPFETRHIWHMDLETAIGLSPSHLSCYMLTIEPGTPLHDLVEKGRAAPVVKDLSSRMFSFTSRMLERAGYEHYEISNFARGREALSRHNSGYWDGTPYSGFGAAAHSFDGVSRSWNVMDINAYLEQIRSGRLPVEDTETLTREQKMLERIMLRLRTLDGLDLDRFQVDFDIRFKDQFAPVLSRILSEGLGQIEHHQFTLTLDGRIHLNGIVEELSAMISS